MDRYTIERGRNIWNAARETRGLFYDMERGLRNGAIGTVVGAAAALLGGPVGWIVGGAVLGAATGLQLPNYKMSEFHINELIARRAETKNEDIPRNGGSVDGGGCVTNFPPNSFDRTCKVDQYTMFSDGMCPPGHTPVTRLVDIKVDSQPKKDIQTKLEALYVPAEPDRETKVKVLQIPSGENRWKILEHAWLSSTAVVRFASRTIDRVIVVVENKSLKFLRYRIKSLLYADNLHNFNFHFFHFHSVMEKEVKNDMKLRGYNMLFDFDAFKASADDKIKATLEAEPTEKFEFKPMSTVDFVINDSFRDSFNKTLFTRTLQARDPSPPPTLYVETTLEVNGTQQGDRNRVCYRWKELDSSPRPKSGNRTSFRGVGEFFPPSKKPALKSSTSISSIGGSSEVGGCTIDFPNNTFHEESKVDASTFVGEFDVPPHCFPVSPTLHCKSSKSLNERAKIKIPIWVSTRDPNVQLAILTKKDGVGEQWRRIESIPLHRVRGRTVEFECKEFSYHRIVLIAFDLMNLLDKIQFYASGMLYYDSNGHLFFGLHVDDESARAKCLETFKEHEVILAPLILKNLSIRYKEKFIFSLRCESEGYDLDRENDIFLADIEFLSGDKFHDYSALILPLLELPADLIFNCQVKHGEEEFGRRIRIQWKEQTGETTDAQQITHIQNVKVGRDLHAGSSGTHVDNRVASDACKKS